MRKDETSAQYLKKSHHCYRCAGAWPRAGVTDLWSRVHETVRTCVFCVTASSLLLFVADAIGFLCFLKATHCFHKCMSSCIKQVAALLLHQLKLNTLCANFFIGNIKMYSQSLSFLHTELTGCWNLFPHKASNYLFYIAIIMVLATQAAMASATILLTLLNRNNSVFKRGPV